MSQGWAPRFAGSGRSVDRLRSVPLGERVVVRYLLPSGSATDALGELVERDATSCVVRTRRGPVRIPLAEVVAAKPVPPAPQRRAGSR